MAPIFPRHFNRILNSLIFGAINFPLIFTSSILISFISPSLFSLLEQIQVENYSWILKTILCWIFEILATGFLFLLLFFRRRHQNNSKPQFPFAAMSFTSMLNALGIGYCCQINPSKIFTSSRFRSRMENQREKRREMEKAQREIFGTSLSSSSSLSEMENEKHVSENESASFAAAILWQILFSVGIAASVVVFELESFSSANGAIMKANSEFDDEDDGVQSYDLLAQKQRQEAIRIAEIIRPIFFVVYSLFWLVLLGFWSGFDERGGDLVSSTASSGKSHNEEDEHLELN
jgi:hypothetical protein